MEQAGFRSTSRYNVTTAGKVRPDFTERYEDVMDAHRAHWEKMAASPLVNLPVVTMGWDSTPRCRPDVPWPFPKREYPYGPVVVGNTPELFEQLLRDAARHIERDPPPDIRAVMPDCPVPVVALLNKMLAEDRAHRHASYDELIAEMVAAHNAIGQEKEAPTVTQARASKSVTRDSRLVMGGVVAVAVLLLLVGLFIWSPWKSRTDEQGRPEGAKTGSESRLQAESVSGQPAKAGTPNAVASASAALKLLGNVYTNAVGPQMVYIPPGELREPRISLRDCRSRGLA